MKYADCLQPSDQSPAALAAQLQELPLEVTLDMETAFAPICFEGRDQVRLLQLLGDSHTYAYDLQTWSDAHWDVLGAWLDNPQLRLVGHNISFDYRCLVGCGMTVLCHPARHHGGQPGALQRLQLDSTARQASLWLAAISGNWDCPLTRSFRPPSG